jgi:hypothetical protein
MPLRLRDGGMEGWRVGGMEGLRRPWNGERGPVRGAAIIVKALRGTPQELEDLFVLSLAPYLHPTAPTTANLFYSCSLALLTPLSSLISAPPALLFIYYYSLIPSSLLFTLCNSIILFATTLILISNYSLEKKFHNKNAGLKLRATFFSTLFVLQIYDF